MKHRQSSVFTILFSVGTIILIASLICSYYPNSVIAGLEGNLSNSALSQEDRWMYQGSLDWWHIERLTVYQPVSYLLTVSAILIIVYAIMSVVFAIASAHINQKSPPPPAPPFG